MSTNVNTIENIELEPNRSRLGELIDTTKRLIGRSALILGLLTSSYALTAYSNEQPAEATTTFTNDYPDSDAVDCSGFYGKYSWCKGTPTTPHSPRGYDYMNCTDGAAYWTKKYTGVDVAGWGDAKSWDESAIKNPNYTIKPGNSKTIEPGDIAQSDDGGYGHVGFVLGVNKNADGTISSITTAELNKGGMGEYTGPDANIYNTRNSSGNFVRWGTNDWDHFIDVNGLGKGLNGDAIGSSGKVFKAPGDYNNNGNTDLALYRPSEGAWHIRNVNDFGFGFPGDIPVPGDYDGNGMIEAAVFRPSTGMWHIRGGENIAYGRAGDIPVPADYNNDKKTDIALFRPSEGGWHIRNIDDFIYGKNGDIPVVGDYDGNGFVEAAVFNPPTGMWYIRGGTPIHFGQLSDTPVPADWNNDGITDPAVYRPSDGGWHIQKIADFGFGFPNDIPMVGDFDGNKIVEAALYRPSTGMWHLRGVDNIHYGQSGDIPALAPMNAAILKQLGLVS